MTDSSHESDHGRDNGRRVPHGPVIRVGLVSSLGARWWWCVGLYGSAQPNHHHSKYQYHPFSLETRTRSVLVLVSGATAAATTAATSSVVQDANDEFEYCYYYYYYYY